VNRVADRGRRIALPSCVVSLALLASLAMAPSVLAAPRLVIAPSNGTPGAAIKATASGFPVGSVEFLWDGVTSLGSKATDDNGRAILSLDVPGSAAPGDHFIRACSPGCAVSAQSKVHVVPVPTPTPGSPAPTPAPTPKVTPRPTPTPRPSSPLATARVPGATSRPDDQPSPAAPSPSGGGDSASPSLVPSPRESSLAAASPTPEGLMPPPAGSSGDAEATTAPNPLAAGTASDSGRFEGRLVVPIGVLGVVIIAGLFIARSKGRSSPSGATTATSHDGSAAAIGVDDGPGSGLPPTETAPVDDRWVSARTISVHVEQVDTGLE